MGNGISSVSINWIRSKLWMPLVLNAFNRIFVRWSTGFEYNCWHAKCKTLWVIGKAQKRLPTVCCWVLEWSCWWDHLSSQTNFQLGRQSRALHNNLTIALIDRHSRDHKRLQTKPQRVINKSSETLEDAWRKGEMERDKNKKNKRNDTRKLRTLENQWTETVSQSSTGIEKI